MTMCLRYSFEMITEADRLEAAIAQVLDDGLRTGDIMSEGMTQIGTTQMGAAILEGPDNRLVRKANIAPVPAAGPF